MANENEEDIIDSDQDDQNNEDEVNTDDNQDEENSGESQEENNSDDDQAEGSQDDDESQDDSQQKKPRQESDEDKHARLKRQLERQERKMGLRPPKKSSTESQSEATLSPRDNIALIRANVHEDDVNDVIDYAKYHKISVADALKSDILQATLKDRTEKRNTANATHTGRARSGSSRASGESSLRKAQATGEIPTDPVALDAMLDERYKSKK